MSLRGVIAGKEIGLDWSVQTEGLNPDLAFLPKVVERARLDGGLLLPTAGSDALKSLGSVLMSSSEELVKDARYALGSGDRESAIAIATEALKRSPNSLSAKNILDAAMAMESTDNPARRPAVSSDASKGAELPKEKPVKAPHRPKMVKFIAFQAGDDPFGTPATQPAQDPFEDDKSATPPANVVPPSTPVVPAEPAPAPALGSDAGSMLGILV